MPRRRQRSDPIDPTDILLEFRVHGNFVKVAALDQATGIEVAILGPVGADRAALEQAAVSKLRYVLDKGVDGDKWPSEPPDGYWA